MEFLLLIAAYFILYVIYDGIRHSAWIKKEEKARRKAMAERDRRHSADPTLIHTDAITAYTNFLDDQRKGFASRRRSVVYHPGLFEEGWLRLNSELRAGMLPFDSELRAYIGRSGETPADWTVVSEMQRVLCRAIARDTALNRTQVKLLTKNVASALEKHLTEEAAARTREEEKRRAEEAERVRRAVATQERIEKEQGLLFIRLRGLHSSGWNASAGRLPVESALKTDLPSQRCFFYCVDVGGEAYVGYTTTTPPAAAMEEHVSRSRRGSMDPLHKALRRFGYVYETGILAETGDEVRGLLARLAQIGKIRPALNRSFEGEGEQFDLVEQINEMGEKILYVENKKVCRVHDRLRRRSDPAYLQSILQRIQHRYARIERKSGATRSSTVTDAHSKAWAGSANELTSSDVVAFAHERRKALAALRNGHQAER